ncbi:hypothetical protein [Tropicimonas sp. IMCC34043]|uniref:hypothetical protein n=1 Tax=Tropicimonas sp. IMCC34043 TaxID=2248760 RepID=UPI000E25DF82|nr:hypothetical protein [Tropicimonas sp. IMCC34043]
MSLAMWALRTAAVEALRGATLVGDNVLDSEIAPLDLGPDGRVTTDRKQPFIAVYTDAADHTLDATTRLRGNGVVEVVFNTGVSAAMAVADRETGRSEIVEGLPATDASLELILDILACQIWRVLSDPGNPWAQVFLELGQIRGKSQARSSSGAERLRLAAGQLRISVEALPDPILGQDLPPASPWRRLLALMLAAEHPNAALFAMMLGEHEPALYPQVERLLGAPVRNVEAMGVYEFGGVGRDVAVTDAALETGAD